MKLNCRLPEDDVHSWKIEDVINWTKKLSLDQDYSELLRENGVDGIVLADHLNTKEEWHELGVMKFGDVFITFEYYYWSCVYYF